LRENRQGKRKWTTRELFWWLTGRKYKFGRVVEREEKDGLELQS
jgi:hypothetical protein